jgi:hypothetical protein
MNKRKDSWLYLLILLLVAGSSIVFVSVMGFLNYKTSALALEEQVITRIEQDSVSTLETAIGFGKSFRNYYGMDDIFTAFDNQVDGTTPFVIAEDGELLYCHTGDELREGVEKFLTTSEFERAFPNLDEETGGIVTKDHLKMILTPILILQYHPKK